LEVSIKYKTKEFGAGFANFFPLLIFFFAFITFFNLLQRILYIFGIKQFIFNASSLGSDEYINDGKDLLARARKDRSRKLKVAMKFDEEKLSKLSEKTRNAILNQNKKKSVSDKIENNDLSKFLGKKNITIDVEDDDSDRSENTN
jgi:hypothetical protein